MPHADCPESCIFIAVCADSAHSSMRLAEQSEATSAAVVALKEELLAHPDLLDAGPEIGAQIEKGLVWSDAMSALIDNARRQSEAFRVVAAEALASCLAGPGENLVAIPGKKTCRSGMPDAQKHSAHLITDLPAQRAIARLL